MSSVNGASYSYDNNGNVLSDGTWSHGWDYNNRLISSSNGSVNVTYAYDYSGNRVKYSDGTKTTYYPNKFYNIDSNGKETSHIYAGGQLVATIEDNSVKYIHTDHLSGSNVITDEDGVLEQVLDYTPFGDIRLNEQMSSFDEQRKFTGYEHDDDTDLEYANARYYNGNVGKFLSVDPVVNAIGNELALENKYNTSQITLLANPQSLNSYSYVSNNPLKYTDPSGALQVDESGASEEEIQVFNEGHQQLIERVKENQQIIDYFNEFGIDIVDAIENDNAGPEVNLGGWHRWFNINSGGAGWYSMLNNDIYFNDGAFESAESVGQTLIHELGHWANDTGNNGQWGEVNPDISSYTTTAKSDRFEYSGEISVKNYVLYDRGFRAVNKDTIYGYAPQIMLYNKIGW